jgi:CHASE2 domain-containing sensor protein
MFSWFKRRLPHILMAGSMAGLAGLILAPSVAPFLLRFEHQTADWRTSTFATGLDALHPGVAVVLISESTLEDYPYVLPPDRGLLAKIVRALDRAGAKAIGLDFYFARNTEPAKDGELIAAVREAKANVVIGALDERGRLGARQMEVQRAFIAATGRSAGYVNLRTEPDGIVRFRAGPAGGSSFPASFAARLAEASGATADAAEGPIAWLKTWRGRQPFLTLPAEALLAGSAAHAAAEKDGALSALKGKTVVVGGDIAHLDRHATPLSGKGRKAEPGVFVHAHDVAQRLDGRLMHELGPGAVGWLLFVVATAAGGLGWLFGTRHANLVGWTAATSVLVVADVLAFAALRTILPFSLMLAAWVLGATAGRSARTLAQGSSQEERVEI